MSRLRTLRRLLCDQSGTMVIETAFVVPVLALMSIGGFEVSGMISRQNELQTAAAEAAQIALAAKPDDATKRAAIKSILMTSAKLPASKVTLTNEYRCGSTVTLVSAASSCAAGVPVTTYLKIYLTDEYAPIWTQFGISQPLTYRVTRRVIVA